MFDEKLRQNVQRSTFSHVQMGKLEMVFPLTGACTLFVAFILTRSAHQSGHMSSKFNQHYWIYLRKGVARTMRHVM